MLAHEFEFALCDGTTNEAGRFSGAHVMTTSNDIPKFGFWFLELLTKIASCSTQVVCDML